MIKNNKKIHSRLLITFVLLCVAIFSSYAWFNNKAPNMISIVIEDPTTGIEVEEYDAQSKTYKAVQSAPNVESIVIDIDEFKFYKWKDSLVSHTGNDQYYRITITNNVLASDFHATPKLELSARYEGVSETEELLGIRPLKANYLLMKPSESETYVSSFPSSGLENLFSNMISMTLNTPAPATESFVEKTFLFPDETFADPFDIVEISGKEKYQSVVYIKVTPDKEFIETILQSISNLETATVKNKLILDFSFRSMPFYTPPPSPTPNP